jgi:SAM-dependent methyltransferase
MELSHLFDAADFPEWVRKVKRHIHRQYALGKTSWVSVTHGTTSFAVACPICGWQGEKFLDYDCGYGNIYRNADCPRCHAQPRHRLLFAMIRKLIEQHGPSSLLHISPEQSIARVIASIPHTKYVSADIVPGKAMRTENIEKTSFKNRSFDFILCLDVLEHVTRDTIAMGELRRILSPTGVAIIDVPINRRRTTTFQDPSITTPQARAKAYWQSDHVRLYGRNFPTLLRNAGFIVTPYPVITTAKDRALIRRYGLPLSPMYLCTTARRAFPPLKKLFSD